MSKKILITTYLERHLKKVMPIIQGLQELGGLEPLVLPLTPEEYELANREGIGFSKYEEYIGWERRTKWDFGWAMEALMNAIDTEKPDLFLAIEVNNILRNAVRYCKDKGVK